MSHADFDEDASNRTFNAPNTAEHPIPTIQRYEERKEARKGAGGHDTEDVESTVIDSKFAKLKSYIPGKSVNGEGPMDGSNSPYKAGNQNVEHSKEGEDNDLGLKGTTGTMNDMEGASQQDGQEKQGSQAQDTADPRQKRKNMKKRKSDHDGRQVTDPVTHLQVTIRDFSEKDLKNVPGNIPPPDADPRSWTGSRGASKSQTQLDEEEDNLQERHEGLERRFPPPNYTSAKQQLSHVYSQAVVFGIGSLAMVFSLLLFINQFLLSGSPKKQEEPHSSVLISIVTNSILGILGLSASAGLIWGVRDWLTRRIDNIWEDEIWAASKASEKEQARSHTPESVQWLNSLLSSVWPLINPELFTSLADTLEDVMQASLPKMVRMISVEDLGQGSESIQILGVRWLPTGAAAKTVSLDGTIKNGQDEGKNDRSVPGEGEIEDDARNGGHSRDGNIEEDGKEQSGEEKKQEGQDQSQEESVAEGMEAEEGDFVNVEIAFSYRASSSGKGLKKKVKNAHLYLAFYLYAGIKFPVWVELQGIVGTMRLRLQLCPDPPFFSLCTLTLLGQPRANLSCLPLTKHMLNIMDIPLISSFVQSSIDAALAEYVAPKSLTLDLKDMLVGDDFKKDTSARGVLVVNIKRAWSFKEGDGGIANIKKGSSDAYVNVGWAKFGKPVWSTRVITNDMEPVWDETTFIMVGTGELNAEERLRVQIFDSDRNSVDDDLGRVEVDLKELMHDSRSKGRNWTRQDGLIAMDADEKMPGTIEWSVGYYDKLPIQEEQLAKQDVEPDIKTVQQLKDKVSDEAEKKLRETKLKNKRITREVDQQKAQDLKIREDQLLISSPPPSEYPIGIVSVVVHNITGLQFEQTSKNDEKGDEGDDTEGGSDDLPSAYCTIILNHQMIFKTRTKPKNSKPFYNAGCERVIRDWKTTDIMISVRDSRVKENDPLIGMIYLPLNHLFKKRSQIVDFFPLVGGIGYGKARISLVFRSVEMHIPREFLGWDYGTLEISKVTSSNLPTDLEGLRLKLHSTLNRGKMHSQGSGSNEPHSWAAKHDRNVHLAVRKRYSSCMVIEFRKNSLTKDKTPAFAILWLKDICDEEDITVDLPVWSSADTELKRAQANCLSDMGSSKSVGTLHVSLKFWRGLGRFHEKLARKNPNLKDVMEVLDTASDNKEVREAMGGIGDSDSDSSNSDPDDDDLRHGQEEKDGDGIDDGYDGHNQVNGKRGPIDQIRDYKDHHKQLHRQHRGLMQFKHARTAQWMKTKVNHGKDRVEGILKHQDKDQGIETEV
ncbi:hypothetical protein MMC25_002825 [Agyrium rufum]|nr:hypothetical protein [Agyrium rufum]